jgi:hypothetical protein
VPTLGALVTDFLKSAETDSDFTREQLREFRGALAHVVASKFAAQDARELSAADVHALVEELRADGVSSRRAGEVVHSLRLVFAHAIAGGVLRVSPLVGAAAVAETEAEAEADATRSPSPTTAMLTLGTDLVEWFVRLIVIAFVLTAIGLAVALV